MRILLATDAFPPRCGGSGWSTYELAAGLRSRGHEVAIVRAMPGRPRAVTRKVYQDLRVREFGFPEHNLPYIRDSFKNERLSTALSHYLARVMREERIDVIHGQHVLTGPPAVHAGRAAGVPSVCTVRDYWPVCYWSDLLLDPASDELCPGCSARRMTTCVRPRAGAAWPLALPMIPYMRRNLARKQEALRLASAVIAVSSTIARDLRERSIGLDAARLEIIPNPVDIARLRAEAARSRCPLPRPYVAYAGKLAPNKGVSKLLAAAERARLTWPIVVVGDGPDRPALQAAAARTGCDVRFVGWLPRSDALGWLGHASVVAFPSRGPESLSRVLLEASALGRAIAAMDTGGTRDIITHDVTGLLSTSVEGLADDLARLVQDAGLRARLGAAARDGVERSFDAPSVVARVEALYLDLLGRQPGSNLREGVAISSSQASATDAP